MTTKKKMSDAKEFLTDIAGVLTLSRLISATRQGEDLSQVEFAKLLGVSKQYVCDIEHGRRFISPKMAAKFAKKLGYSPRQFVRLCLQDLVNREGLKLIVNVEEAA